MSENIIDSVLDDDRIVDDEFELTIESPRSPQKGDDILFDIQTTSDQQFPEQSQLLFGLDSNDQDKIDLEFKEEGLGDEINQTRSQMDPADGETTPGNENTLDTTADNQDVCDGSELQQEGLNAGGDSEQIVQSNQIDLNMFDGTKDSRVDTVEIIESTLGGELHTKDVENAPPVIQITIPADTKDSLSAEDVYLKQSKEFTDINAEEVSSERQIESGEDFTVLSNMPSDRGENETENTHENDEDTISLDNILMKDKEASDSGSEFDFELPTTKPAAPALKVLAVETDKKVLKEDKVADAETRPSEERTMTIQEKPDVCEVKKVVDKPVAIIKPTTQAMGMVYQVEAPVVDEKKQRILDAAKNEWDNVRTIQAGYSEMGTVKGAEPTVVETVKPMSPYELIQSFQQENFASVRSSIRPSVERHGLAAFVNMLFGPPKLNRSLHEARDKVFCIAASQLNNENSNHIRTLQTIYRCLTGSKFDCARVGSHWEEIGFQGTDPATDLRGAGLLGLLNLLYFLKDPKKQSLASDVYRLSIHPTQNFPFCVMGMNMSRITIQTLREDLLNKECNRRGDVMGVVNEFYVGLYLQLYQVWKGQGKTISDSGFVIKDIETKAKKNPRAVLKNLEDYLNKKTTIVIADRLPQSGGDDFVNVCDNKDP